MKLMTMKLMTMSCAAMLAIAPTAIGFAQQTSYPDLEAIAKTGAAPQKPAPEKAAPAAAAPEKAAPEKGATSTGVLGTVVETITGRPSPPKEEVPPMSTAEKKSVWGGQTSYPDQGSIAKLSGAK